MCCKNYKNNICHFACASSPRVNCPDYSIEGPQKSGQEGLAPTTSRKIPCSGLHGIFVNIVWWTCRELHSGLTGFARAFYILSLPLNLLRPSRQTGSDGRIPLKLQHDAHGRAHYAVIRLNNAPRARRNCAKDGLPNLGSASYCRPVYREGNNFGIF